LSTKQRDKQNYIIFYNISISSPRVMPKRRNWKSSKPTTMMDTVITCKHIFWQLLCPLFLGYSGAYFFKYIYAVFGNGNEALNRWQDYLRSKWSARYAIECKYSGENV